MSHVYLLYTAAESAHAAPTDKPEVNLHAIFANADLAGGSAALWISAKNHEHYDLHGCIKHPVYSASTDGECVKYSTPPFRGRDIIFWAWTEKREVLSAVEWPAIWNS
jgi:hypothetical protein